jgi:hypothetical protein
MTEAEFQRFVSWAQRRCPDLDLPASVLLQQYRDERIKRRVPAKTNAYRVQSDKEAEENEPCLIRRIQQHYKRMLIRKQWPEQTARMRLYPGTFWLEQQGVSYSEPTEITTDNAIPLDDLSWDNVIRSYEDRYEAGSPIFQYMRD